ncbi:MAG: OmpA family protein, partial [Bacteroidota bacterium]|nr:OmpA family protein [Bacteroidota bacterium]
DNNLIENGSFEDYTGKLKRMGSIEMATGWRNATGEPADLFTELVPAAPITAPRNQYGDQSPLTGKNYAGVRWWSFQNKEPRSYIQAKFKTMLKKGQKYCVKYYVSLADLSKYSSSEVGAYISKVMVNKEETNSLTYVPQVPHLRSKIYEDMYSWQGVCGVYEATGGEQTLLIGNFSPNEKTVTGKPTKPEEEDRAQLPHAYYYIDDVSVTPIKLPGECTCEQLDKAESEFIFSRKGITQPSLKPAERIDQQVFYFKRFQRNVATSMEPWISEMAELMKGEPAVMVKLIGHIDDKEKERARMRPDMAKLGDDRAIAVKEALIEHGIEATRITTGSSGSDKPVDQTGTEVGMSKNRRVEVELVK